MVFKTTFGQSQKWSLIRGTLDVVNEEKNNLNFAYKEKVGSEVLYIIFLIFSQNIDCGCLLEPPAC